MATPCPPGYEDEPNVTWYEGEGGWFGFPSLPPIGVTITLHEDGTVSVSGPEAHLVSIGPVSPSGASGS